MIYHYNLIQLLSKFYINHNEKHNRSKKSELQKLIFSTNCYFAFFIVGLCNVIRFIFSSLKLFSKINEKILKKVLQLSKKYLSLLHKKSKK